MSQQTINIGTGPSAGDGDPLRTAFTKINSNFNELYANVGNLSNSVTTVAGRTGNVTLTTQDIIGITNLPFTMANANHWTSNVTTVTDALNQIAARLFAANI